VVGQEHGDEGSGNVERWSEDDANCVRQSIMLRDEEG
jgi:hypothetical protein